MNPTHALTHSPTTASGQPEATTDSWGDASSTTDTTDTTDTTTTTTTTQAPAPAEAAPEVELHPDFESMGLKDELLRGVFAYGLETPSAIQQKAIVPTAAGRDVLMHAQSGTGKTGAFTIGLLDRIDTSAPGTQCLILSPTRDLALQTQRVVLAIGDYLKASCHASIGGRSGRADGDALRQDPHVVTGTPGRVVDNIQRGSLNVRGIQTLVLDEVDVLLEEGFVDAIQDVIRSLPRDCQILAVSATYTPAVHGICDKFLQNPVKIVIPQEEITLDGIKQFYVDTGSDQYKLDVLLDLYETLNASQSVIFVNTRRRAVELAQQMDDADHTVSVIHGELEQAERDLRLREFVSGASRVLIATDIVARGIDAQQVSVVVNVDLPNDRANYIHRIGRCGRFGRKGVAINLIGGERSRDVDKLRDLQEYYGTIVEEMPANVLDYLA